MPFIGKKKLYVLANTLAFVFFILFTISWNFLFAAIMITILALYYGYRLTFEKLLHPTQQTYKAKSRDLNKVITNDVIDVEIIDKN